MKGELFVPIVLFLVTGIVIVSFIYYKSKEKQLLIEKGFSPEQILELFKRKIDPYILMKIGIILFFFGLGLGLGMWLEDMNFNHKDYGNDYWIPLCMFTFTGVGFVLASLTNKLNKGKENK
jgi:hypothetical protein